jgi:CHAD domain-containing protein
MLAHGRQMMTTDRTPIRRRLAIRRATHRPPWGRGKAGHLSILAPRASKAAATLAAAVALGLGAALARAERERRSERERRAGERQFALLPHEQPAEGLQRMALAQLDLALELLAGEGARPPAKQALHETRKALKRLRALLRLLKGALDEDLFTRESDALRAIGQRLSAARDAEVTLDTLEVLIERHPRRLARRSGVLRLREELLAERQDVVERTLEHAGARAQLSAELRTVRWNVAAWQLQQSAGLAILEPGLERLYRQGRQRYRRAASGKGERGRALHEWRKRVKDLRYAAEMLERKDPARAKRTGHTKRSKRKPGGAAHEAALRKLEHRADELGEALGEEHDLAVLAERVRLNDGRSRLGRKTRKTLLKLISRRRRELRKRVLVDGARLYRRPPKRFLARVRRAYTRA